MTRTGACAMIAGLFLGATAHAGPDHPCGTPGTDDHHITVLPDTGDISLDDGRTLVPAGVRPASPADILSQLDHERVRIGGNALPPDRYGRVPAQLFRADGSWVQGDLVEAGQALVWPEGLARTCRAVLLQLEDTARKRKAGLWGTGKFRVLAANAVADNDGGFAIVEGKVISAAVTRSGAFVNFGTDWSTDFTVHAQTDDLKALQAEGLDVPSLEGRTIRVRGWLDEWNGPMIRLHTISQIEMIE